MSNLDPDLSRQPDWTDMRVPMSALATVTGAGLKAPSYEKLIDNGAGSTGIYAAAYSNSQEQELFFTAQFSHSYLEGSDIEPHIHWSPSDTINTGSVVWALEYLWVNIGDPITNSTIINLTAAADGTGRKSIMSDFDLIAGAGKLISSQVHGRLFRDVDHPNDDYPDQAFLTELDFHFKQDSLGSALEHTKG